MGQEAVGLRGDNVLQKAFGDDVNRKTLHLCTQYACDALIYLLHSTCQLRMSTHLPFPDSRTVWIRQLQYGDSATRCPQLLNVINRTVTPMGERLFEARSWPHRILERDKNGRWALGIQRTRHRRE
jgi:hypothetical protein